MTKEQLYSRAIYHINAAASAAQGSPEERYHRLLAEAVDNELSAIVSLDSNWAASAAELQRKAQACRDAANAVIADALPAAATASLHETLVAAIIRNPADFDETLRKARAAASFRAPRAA